MVDTSNPAAINLHVATFTLGPFAVHNYLIWDEETLDAVLIDTGKDPNPIVEFIQKKNLTLKGVFYTHAHIDHIEGQGDIKAAFPEAQTHAHPEATFWIERLGQQAAMFQLETPPPVSIDHWIQPGDIFNFSNFKLETRYAPGHAPESLCFYCKELKSVFVGDVIFYKSIGRTDFPRGDHQQLLDSIQREIYSLPEDTVIYSGHGPSTTVGEEKISNPFVQAISLV